MSPYDVQKATGVNKVTVTNWEAGTAGDFLLNKLVRLALYYGVPYTELIEFIPDEAQE